MTTIEASVDIAAPSSVAYQNWAHFEGFPQFMEQIENVQALDSRHFHWHARYGGREEEWESEVIEDIPGKRMAWKSTNGRRNDGIIEFEPLSANSTRVRLRVDYEPRGMAEEVGSAAGMDARLITSNLEGFKRYTEKRASPR